MSIQQSRNGPQRHEPLSHGAMLWLHALTELDKVQNEQREQPSVEAFLAELPTMEWLDSNV